MRMASLDEMVLPDHRVRVVWAMVEEMDLSRFYQRIEAIEGEAGRPAIDPALLVGVWLYATLEGVGSARELARLCEEHLAYRWLMGGIEVNYHTLADFRVEYEQELDDLLTKGVAALMNEGLVDLERTAQDGMKVRASAGASSFRRRPKLEEHLEQAEGRVKELKRQFSAEVGQSTPRRRAAQERAARERVERLKRSLEELAEIEARREQSHKKKDEEKPAKSSSTDPEARIMPQPAGGFRPSHNAQLGIDTKSRIIVSVDVTNQRDPGQMEPMLEDIHQRYDQYPQDHLVDGGYVKHDDIEAAYNREIKVFAPLPQPRREGQQPERSRPEDGPGVRAWRERMTTEAAKTMYKLRAATIEWANALARNRGLYRVLVRGLHKVRSVLLWYALAHNLLRTQTLRENLKAALA
jgi:transposase